MQKAVITSALLCLAGTAGAQSPSPVNQAECAAGGEFGNEIHFNFSRAYVYDRIVINRGKDDFVKELDDFQGGKYRLDVASKGGIQGFELHYRPKNSPAATTLKGSLDCGQELATVPTFIYEEPLEQ